MDVMEYNPSVTQSCVTKPHLISAVVVSRCRIWRICSGWSHLNAQTYYTLHCSLADEQAPTSPDRGLLHVWHSAGHSRQLCPDRVLLSRPVLQVSLGEHHGLLLAQGKFDCSKEGPTFIYASSLHFFSDVTVFQVVRCIHLESFYGGIWASPCLLRCQRSLCWERRWSVWLLAASTAVHWASRVASTCGGRILQDSVGKQRRVQSQTSPVS